MTTITLAKHHGLGNDFLVALDLVDVPESLLPELARELCDRRRGIGADGLLLGNTVEGYTARMVLYNADGSRAEISGNGIRCLAHALWRRDSRLVDQLIVTDAGDRRVEVYAGSDDTRIDASVDMGPVASIGAPSRWGELACDPLRPVLHLSLGNPHSVVAVDDLDVVDLAALGAIVPDVNLEIIALGPEDDAITMRVHERGVGVTEACGSGACASAWAAVEWGLVSPRAREVVVHMAGGDATVRLHQPADGRVTLVGPSAFIGTVVVER